MTADVVIGAAGVLPQQRNDCSVYVVHFGVMGGWYATFCY